MKRHLFGGAHAAPKVRLSGTDVPLAYGSRRVRESCTFAHPVLIPSFAGTSGLRSTGRPGRDVAELLLASGHAIIDVASAAAVGQLLAQQRPLRRLAVGADPPEPPVGSGLRHTRAPRACCTTSRAARRWRGREAASGTTAAATAATAVAATAAAAAAAATACERAAGSLSRR